MALEPGARARPCAGSMIMLCILLGALLMLPAVASAQVTGDVSAATIRGVAREAGSGQPLAGVRISIADAGVGVLSSDDGSFLLRVPQGTYTVVAERIGWRRATAEVQARAGATVELQLELAGDPLALDDIVVTTSREEQRRAETAATVHAIGREEIARVRPSHPSELLNRMPGVWINVTGGEGHMAAIRHPKTTNPVYLYLENGVPTRSTGFFNHNALYEINVPHAERVEVVKGPASVLYGSDAIGGMINVMTRDPRTTPPVQASLEAGSHGFGRALLSASHATATGGVLGEVNLTRTDGWRQGTAYERQTGTLRFDHRFSAATSMRSNVSFSRIDQGTAGSSALSPDDFRNNPEANYTPISYRQVEAVRASAALERLGGGTLLSVTPFVRWNRMEMLPNWSLTFDPAISETGHGSAGVLLRARRDLQPMRLRAIAGLDLDYSPGSRMEWRVAPTRENGVFTSYTRGDVIYDYDVVFRSIAPYVQLEASPVERLRLVGGLRYDALGYDYTTALPELQTGSHRRPASTTVNYTHLSPKLGAVYAVTDGVNVFGSYGHGFRAPSEGQLFRQGRALASLELKPVRADNYELGMNARLHPRVRVELAAYHMRKADDLLSFTHADGATETVNAGETLHRGVEAGLGVALPLDVRVDAAFSRASHTYEEWTLRNGLSYTGNEMEDAPRHTGSLGLTWAPRAQPGVVVAAEAQRVGPYWMDPANTTRYDGHTLVNLRAEVPLLRGFGAFARVTNLLDERYAENAQFTAARGAEYAPGMTRSLFIGVRYQ